MIVWLAIIRFVQPVLQAPVLARDASELVVTRAMGALVLQGIWTLS